VLQELFRPLQALQAGISVRLAQTRPRALQAAWRARGRGVLAHPAFEQRVLAKERVAIFNRARSELGELGALDVLKQDTALGEAEELICLHALVENGDTSLAKFPEFKHTRNLGDDITP
jgi:hypothetical protein